jgi:type VI secretion system protein ImpI
MYLTLEVVSANAASLAGTRRKVFSVEGGRIGRAPENDMVLSGAGVHRHHATVRFINGVFFIEGVGTNGIAVNNPDVVIPRNEPYPIKTGDKVFIDEFEIAVATSAKAPDEVPAARPAAREATRIPDSTSPGRVSAPIVPGQDNEEDLDPLRMLSSPGAAAPRPTRPAVDSAWNHTPSLSDHFTPPPPAAPSGGMTIPENWDKTSFDRSKLQPPAPAAPPPLQRAAPPPPQTSPSVHTPVPRAPQPQRPAPPVASPGHPAVQSGHPAAQSSYGTRPAAPTRAAPPPSSAPPPAHTSSAFDWEGFLRSAGVDPASVPPETAAVMGNIMRSVVQGLIEVLRARSEIKTEFRMPVTQVKVSENNPLKFAANAEDAISNLLGRRNSAYLGPQEAFEDAFNDVRFHQLAMLVGVRAGFDSLMSRFDPEQLVELFERQGKRGGLFGGAKGKYWELYAQRFEELTADRDDTFRRLFGEEFARAYEQQLAALKRTRGGGTQG